jgi:drug/metabolite transporter (DMT)-like permease
VALFFFFWISQNTNSLHDLLSLRSFYYFAGVSTMSVPVAYATIIIVWSTTPLGITWSNETLSPAAAVTTRMGIAAIIGFALLKVFRIPMSWSTKALRTYAYSLMGIFGAMLCTYNAAQFIPSGLISVLYAFAPVLSNLFAYLLLGKGDFSATRWVSFIISFFGLAVICLDDWVLHQDGWIGVVLLLVAVSLHSLSGVLVQREAYHAHPLSLTVGTLILSVPLFVTSWWFMDGELPVLDWSSESPWAVLYLAVFGSLLGFASYFYIVRQLGATAVAMVTLVTPVIALVLGSILNDEAITLQIMTGTACVLFGLVLYYRNAQVLRMPRIRQRAG